MRNERGMTLIEVMASIVVISAVLGAATLLMGSVLQLSANSQQRYQDNSAMRLTENTLTRELSDSIRAAAFEHGPDRELRYQSSAGYRSVYFDSANHRLSLYSFVNGEANFTNAAVTPALNPALYTSRIDLADNMRAAEFQDSSRQALASGTVITRASASQLLYLHFIFNKTFNRASGGQAVSDYVMDISVKLLVDSTDH
jgi:prepilin-type N-terminal cleavage/methylation domain-containing protein